MDVARIREIKNIEERIESLETNIYNCNIETIDNGVDLMEYIDLSVRNKKINPEDSIDLKLKLRSTLGGFKGNCYCGSLFH